MLNSVRVEEARIWPVRSCFFIQGCIRQGSSMSGVRWRGWHISRMVTAVTVRCLVCGSSALWHISRHNIPLTPRPGSLRLCLRLLHLLRLCVRVVDRVHTKVGMTVRRPTFFYNVRVFCTLPASSMIMVCQNQGATLRPHVAVP